MMQSLPPTMQSEPGSEAVEPSPIPKEPHGARTEPTDEELDDVDDMYKNAAKKLADEGAGKPEHDKDQSDDHST